MIRLRIGSIIMNFIYQNVKLENYTDLVNGKNLNRPVIQTG